MISNKATLVLPGYTTNLQSTRDAGHDAEDAVLLNAPAAFHFRHDERQQPWQAQLAQCLNVEVAGGKRLPGARLCLSYGTASENVTVTDTMSNVSRADPVYLKADRDNATLIAPQQLRLSETEADQMLAALNDFYKDDGLTFFRHQPDEWFMIGMRADQLETYPPSFLANRNAGSFLPEGDAAVPWRRLLTEMQMLLHAHPVNIQREQRGLMPVNSVWFWGGAELPLPDSSDDKVTVYADDMQAVALADHLGLATRPLSAVADAIQQLPCADPIVIVDTRIATAWLAGDEQQLTMAVKRVNQDMLEPLSRQIEAGQLASVDVLTEDGLQGLCNLHTISASAPDVADGSKGWLKRLLGFLRR